MAKTTVAAAAEKTAHGPAPQHRAGPAGLAGTLVQRVLQQREATVVTVTLAVVIYFGIASSAFFSSGNIITICQYIAPIAVIGFGEVLILVLAEIDLSAGQVFITAPWITYFVWNGGLPLGVGILVALLCSLAIGFLNGFASVRLRVPSLIVTLAVNYALLGFVLVKSQAIQVNMPGATGEFGQVFGIGSWATILWSAGIMVAMWILLKRTRFGMHTTAAGGNLLAAAEAGIPVRRVRIWCFMIIALIAGFIGILDAIRIGSLNPGNSGLDYVLPGIVAAVVGGTALTGGRGTILGTALGAIFLGVLQDGFNLIGVNANWFYLAEGVMILFAMAANTQLGSLAARWRQ